MSSNIGKSLLNGHIRNQHKNWSQIRGFLRNMSDADVISQRSGGVVNMLLVKERLPMAQELSIIRAILLTLRYNVCIIGKPYKQLHVPN